MSFQPPDMKGSGTSILPPSVALVPPAQAQPAADAQCAGEQPQGEVEDDGGDSDEEWCTMAELEGLGVAEQLSELGGGQVRHRQVVMPSDRKHNHETIALSKQPDSLRF